MTFAAAAARLAGAATRALGWTPDQFWICTPAELASIAAADGGDTEPQPLARSELEILMERDAHG